MKKTAAIFGIGTVLFIQSVSFAAVDHSSLPECGPGEGYVCPWNTDVPPFQYVSNPVCREPNWKLNTKTKEWERAEPEECSENTDLMCASFSYEDLEWRNVQAKKWDLKKFGAHFWQTGDASAPTKKYNQQLDALTECTPGLIGPYFGIPRSNFEPVCEHVAPESEDFWLAKQRSEFKKHTLRWEDCSRDTSIDVLRTRLLESSKKVKLKKSSRSCIQKAAGLIQRSANIPHTGVENITKMISRLERGKFSLIECKKLVKLIKS